MVSAPSSPAFVPVDVHPLLPAPAPQAQEPTEPIRNVTLGPVAGAQQLPVTIVAIQPDPPAVVPISPAAAPVVYDLEDVPELLGIYGLGAGLCLGMSGVAIYLTKELAPEPAPLIVTVLSVTLFSVVACYLLRRMGEINAQVNRTIEGQDVEVSRTGRVAEQVFVMIHEIP